MLKKILPLFIVPLVAANYAHGTTFDYRHEYLADDKVHADRFQISHRFENNIAVNLEAKWASKKVGSNSSNMYDNLISKGHALEVNYKYKVTDNLVLSPGTIIESGSDNTTYKFQLKASYHILPELIVSARYRYGVKDYDRNLDKTSQHYHQGNFVVAYKFEHFSISYDFEIKKTDYPAWKGKERDYVHNVNLQVPIDKAWVPYVELGYVPYKESNKKYKEDWQWRYRFGLKYHF